MLTRTAPARLTALQRVSQLIGADVHLACGLGYVCLVTAVSALLMLQGWRSRIPAFDLLTYIHAVRELVASGAIPQHGDTGSYGSIKPPGTAWLMLPSTLLFADPRLSEYVGAVVLHFLTLLGLFLLARAHFGETTAYLALPLYGLSAHGIFLAGSLWPNGRPDFSVWVVLLIGLWIRRGDARLLAVAAAVWAIGMYVDMALAPALFILPVLWLVYRPPVRLRPLVAAGALALVIWAPYLSYEAPRGFRDIRSQLLLQGIDVGTYRTAWCDPSLLLLAWEDQTAPGPSQAPIAASLSPLTQVPAIMDELGAKLVSNFDEATLASGAGTLLLLLTLGGLLCLGVPGVWLDDGQSSGRRLRRQRLLILGIGLMLVGPVLAELLVALYAGLVGQPRVGALVLIRRAENIALKAAIVLALGGLLAATARALLIRWRVRFQPDERARQTGVLALCLVVPWVILVVVAEPGKPERFWWLWPLQILFLAAFLTTVLSALATPRSLRWAVAMLAAGLLLVNPLLVSRVEAWRQGGWAGSEAEEMEVAASIARHLGPERREAPIGYQIFVYEFMAAYHVTNPTYKVGADIDVLLRYAFDIENTSRCAEGLSPDDAFRIVQIRPKPEAWSPRSYFAVPPDGRFRLLQEIGKYQIWRRG